MTDTITKTTTTPEGKATDQHTKHHNVVSQEGTNFWKVAKMWHST